MNIVELMNRADSFNRKEIRKYTPDLEYLYEIALKGCELPNRK